MWFEIPGADVMEASWRRSLYSPGGGSLVGCDAGGGARRVPCYGLLLRESSPSRRDYD